MMMMKKYNLPPTKSNQLKIDFNHSKKPPVKVIKLNQRSNSLTSAILRNTKSF